MRDLLLEYLTEDCQLVSVTGRRRLRSSDTDPRLLQRTNTRLGDRSFAAAGPQVWNSLQTQLQESDITLEQFRRADQTASLWLLKAPVPSDSFWCAVYKLTYLLTYFVVDPYLRYSRFRP